MSINRLESELQSAIMRVGDGNVRMTMAKIGTHVVGELRRMDKELKELKAQIEEMKGQ